MENKTKIHVITKTIDNGIHVDSDYFADAEITYYDKKTVFEYVDNEGGKNILTTTDTFIHLERNHESESTLDLVLDENTFYNVKTPFGYISLGINTLDILINNEFIYAKYYILPDTNTYHELKISVVSK